MNSHIYSVDGIILKRTARGEADRIITLYTKQYGKIRLIARGVRKIQSRRGSHLESFRVSRITAHKGNGLDTISEAVTIRGNDAIGSDLTKTACAYFIVELIDRLTAENEAHDEVYVLLSDTLRKVTETETRKELITITTQFAHELLVHLGFALRENSIPPKKLIPYIEAITERHLTTPKIIRTIFAS